MPLRCCAIHMFLLLCALSLCVESVIGGTSFLSPAQKPQGRRPPWVGRRDAAEPEIPVIKEDDQPMGSTPFEPSMSLSEAEYEKYGPVLQKVLVNLLSDFPLEF
ncbi:ghrelin-like [Sinocyclocheilus anshuiensis]|uniref:Ghrelin-like n=1 Tax=Sinocyclocheilus anshuiensis TaxID=1608454 RepID=A0A671MCB8_9TELE|nr:PREDICTED: ghrelin-like [Sinocyclocheilus anshuiensis]